MLVRRLVRSIRNIPGAVQRLLRAVLRVALHVAGIVQRIMHSRSNSPASPTLPPVMCEPSGTGRGARYSTSLAPVSLTTSPSFGNHDYPLNNYPPSNSSSSMRSVVHTPDIPLSIRHTTSFPTINAIPITPENIQRYLRRKPVERKPNKQSISAGKIDYSEKAPPGVWKRFVHPEGARYYFNPDKHVFTDVDITQYLVEIDQHISFLREKESQVVPSRGPPSEATQTQLVIQLDEEEEGDKREWLYYFVNHETRVIFWLHEFETTQLVILNDLQGVTADSHIRYAIEVQYWLHCEQYPNCSSVSQDHVTELCGMVVHASADRSTSEAPLSTLNETQLAKLLTLTPYLQCNVLSAQMDYIYVEDLQKLLARVGAIDAYALWVIARAMGIFAGMKFYHFYGQPEARLEADLSIYIESEEDDKISPLFMALDIFLFYTPSGYIEELSGIWVDSIINYPRWVDFSNKLSTEWTGFTIYSTVMLAVDASLLSVLGVNNGSVGAQLVAKVAIYMSLLSILGSLLSSALLVRQNHALSVSATGAASFIYTMTQWGGFKALGIMYSLPFALLIWAMTFFLLALSCVIVESSDHATLGVIGVSAILVGSLTLLPIWWGRIPCRVQGDEEV